MLMSLLKLTNLENYNLLVSFVVVVVFFMQCFFFFYASQLMNEIDLAHFPWNNLYLLKPLNCQLFSGLGVSYSVHAIEYDNFLFEFQVSLKWITWWTSLN